MLRAKAYQVPSWNDLAPLTYQHHWDNTAPALLQNDGDSVHLQLQDYENVPTIYGGPLSGTYQLDRVDFYWGWDNASGAHHIIGNDPIAMEIHTCYYNSNCEIPTQVRAPEAWVVVSTRFTVGSANPTIKAISQLVPVIVTPYSSVIIKSNYLSWLKRPQMDRGYITYNTKQADDSNVTWIIYIHPSTISNDQVDVFRTVFNGDGVRMKENLSKMSIIPKNKEIVVVDEIPFVPVCPLEVSSINYLRD